MSDPIEIIRATVRAGALSGDAASEDTDCQSFDSMDDGDAAIVGCSDQIGIGWTQQDLIASCIDTWRLCCSSEPF